MKSLDHYLSLPYLVSVTLERCTDGSVCYVARVVDLPGCESHGASPEQALQHLKEAKKLFIASMLADGVAPDPPHNKGCVAALAHDAYAGCNASVANQRRRDDRDS